MKYIGFVSWHDYHAGWLTDAQGIKRMRQNMDEAGGKQLEIWFNEGWTYTNTAVDEPIACPPFNSKPREGGAKTYRLSLRKKDTQRAAEIITLQLPRDGTSVAIKTEIELTAGHERLFVPMTQDLHKQCRQHFHRRPGDQAGGEVVVVWALDNC